jgi:flavorubredoxin
MNAVWVRIFVGYGSKYSNTKRGAENVLEGMKEVDCVESAICYVKEVNSVELANHDVVLGAPNHMGRLTRAMKKFVAILSKVDLKAKHVAVFGTYAGKARPSDIAMEKMVKKKLPKLNLFSLELSARVNWITGLLVEGELPKCVKFGKKVAEHFKSQ